VFLLYDGNMTKRRHWKLRQKPAGRSHTRGHSEAKTHDIQKCGTDAVRWLCNARHHAGDEPRQRACVTLHSQCGVRHLHVSQTLLNECYQGTSGREHKDDILIQNAGRVRDETIARLGVALVHAIDERAQAFL
jgi:hypothetical protein